MQQATEQKLPFPLRPKFDRSALPIILWNLFPFAGVLFLGWKPESVFVCYALETIVVGIFNVLRLIVVYRYGQPPKLTETGVTGLGIIPFFIFHYYFFVFVQLAMFFGGTKTPGNWPFGIVLNIVTNPVYSGAMLVFVLNCIASFITGFIRTGIYTRRTMAEQMFEPYPRIFVQQFVVILGGFIFSVTGNGYPVLVIFVAIKLYMDLILKDFDVSALNHLAGQKVDNSA